MSDPTEEPFESVQRRAFAALAWYFNERHQPTGVYHSIGGIHDQLAKLNENPAASTAASDRLSTTVNRLTLWGVLVAAAGVLVAAVQVIHDIWWGSA
jgi:hypothetical protein